MNNRFFSQKIIFLLALYSSFTQGQDFIFDFGGVLILTNKIASLRQLGMLNIASCSLQLGINPFGIDKYIQHRFFSILDEIAIIHNLVPTKLYQQTYDEKGNRLPFLISAWLQGTWSAGEVLAIIHNEINMHPEWFKCQAEKRIIQNTARLIFTPALFAQSRKISSAAIAFIKKCKREGHKVYGLSNWDAESFALLKERYIEVFNLFDGIVISAQENANKPHATIYQILLDRYQLQAENCWFIDDQRENIEAAKELGINAIQHTSTFKRLLANIKTTYSESLSLRKSLTNNGIIDNNAKSANATIIDGENISFTDSIECNCLPANV